jgi:hypothetical protein
MGCLTENWRTERETDEIASDARLLALGISLVWQPTKRIGLLSCFLPLV